MSLHYHPEGNFISTDVLVRPILIVDRNVIVPDRDITYAQNFKNIGWYVCRYQEAFDKDRGKIPLIDPDLIQALVQVEVARRTGVLTDEKAAATAYGIHDLYGNPKLAIYNASNAIALGYEPLTRGECEVYLECVQGHIRERFTNPSPSDILPGYDRSSIQLLNPFEIESWGAAPMVPCLMRNDAALLGSTSAGSIDISP